MTDILFGVPELWAFSALGSFLIWCFALLSFFTVETEPFTESVYSSESSILATTFIFLLDLDFVSWLSISARKSSWSSVCFLPVSISASSGTSSSLLILSYFGDRLLVFTFVLDWDALVCFRGDLFPRFTLPFYFFSELPSVVSILNYLIWFNKVKYSNDMKLF